MKTKTLRKTLVLSTETVRALDLDRVQGGGYMSAFRQHSLRCFEPEQKPTWRRCPTMIYTDCPDNLSLGAGCSYSNYCQ